MNLCKTFDVNLVMNLPNGWRISNYLLQLLTIFLILMKTNYQFTRKQDNQLKFPSTPKNTNISTLILQKTWVHLVKHFIHTNQRKLFITKSANMEIATILLGFSLNCTISRPLLNLLIYDIILFILRKVSNVKYFWLQI